MEGFILASELEEVLEDLLDSGINCPHVSEIAYIFDEDDDFVFLNELDNRLSELDDNGFSVSLIFDVEGKFFINGR